MIATIVCSSNGASTGKFVSSVIIANVRVSRNPFNNGVAGPVPDKLSDLVDKKSVTARAPSLHERTAREIAVRKNSDITCVVCSGKIFGHKTDRAKLAHVVVRMADRSRESSAKSDFATIFSVNGRSRAGRTRVGVSRAVSKSKVGTVRKVSDSVVDNRVRSAASVGIVMFGTAHVEFVGDFEVVGNIIGGKVVIEKGGGDFTDAGERVVSYPV